jgi:hypothetical protein
VFSSLLYEHCTLLGVGKSVAEESGEDKGSLVKLRVIVAELHVLRNEAERGTARSVLLGALGARLGANNEANLTERVGGDLGSGVLNALEHVHALDLRDEVGDELNVVPHGLALGGNLTTSLEGGGEVGVEGALEEGSGRANGVRSISNDDVELASVLGALDVLRSVTTDELDLGIRPGNSNLGEVLLGAINDHLVNLADVHLLDGLVLDNLTNDTAVTTTDDKDGLGVRVAEERDVGDRLLVGHLIKISDLDDTIKNKDVTVVLGLEDDNVLEEVYKW